MALNMSKIDVRCPHCGKNQKTESDLFETVCKKCGQTFETDTGVELYLNGDMSRPAVETDGLSFDELYERGVNFLNAEDYGMAQELLAAALKLNPDSAQALWMMCRAVMCTKDIVIDDALVAYVSGDEQKGSELYAAAHGISVPKAAYELKRLSKTSCCFTDEESDDLYEAALEAAKGDFAKEIRDKYAVYSYRPRQEAEAAQGEILPSFGKQRSLYDRNVLMVLIFGALATIGGLIMICCGLANGWTIALLVVGIFVFLIGFLAFYMDSRRRLICKIVLREHPASIEEIAKMLTAKKGEISLAQVSSYVLATMYSLIRSSYLVGVGVRNATEIVYFDEEGLEITGQPDVFESVDVVTEQNTIEK